MKREWYKNILLTGEPWCGKSTLLQELVATVDHKTGFITQEIRDDAQQRIWFEVISSWGERASIASKTEKSDILFAEKYRIQTDSIKKILSTLTIEIGDLLYIDEIAPMQLYAPWFQSFAEWWLSTKNPLLGAIKLDDFQYPAIQHIKKRKDTLVIDIMNKNTIYNKGFLFKLAWKIWKSQRYLQEPERFHQINKSMWKMNSSSAERKLIIENWIIHCDCQFYTQYGICSHSIALRQII